jgi:hypothetical protein
MRIGVLAAAVLAAGCGGGEEAPSEKPPFQEGLFLKYRWSGEDDDFLRYTFTRAGKGWSVAMKTEGGGEAKSATVALDEYGRTPGRAPLGAGALDKSAAEIPLWIPSSRRQTGAVAWRVRGKSFNPGLGSEGEEKFEGKVIGPQKVDERWDGVLVEFRHDAAIQANSFAIRTWYDAKTGFLIKHDYTTFIGAGNASFGLVETNAK